MYSISQSRRALKTPSLIGRELNRLYYGYRGPPNNPYDLFETDWHNLVLLDACRFDLFVDSTAKWTAEPVYSPASNTADFLKTTLDNRSLHDTVYVTANPQFHRHRSEIEVEFYRVVNLWSGDTWDDELGTVRPDVVTDATQRVYDQHPDKRLLVHFMQPHFPFVPADFDSGHVATPDNETNNFWSRIMYEEVSLSRKAVWEAYLENLEYALPHVETLIDSIPGTTVITSDHGNMLGESGGPIPVQEWGHPRGILTEELTKVPWVSIDGTRREPVIAEEPTTDRQEVSEEVATDRLEALGYKQ